MGGKSDVSMLVQRILRICSRSLGPLSSWDGYTKYTLDATQLVATFPSCVRRRLMVRLLFLVKLVPNPMLAHTQVRLTLKKYNAI
eukprot:3444813-Amphidinium_carterae.1